MYSVYTEDDIFDDDMLRLQNDKDRLDIEKHTKTFNLLDAVVTNDIKRVKAISITGLNKNAESDTGLTPLILAVLSCNYEMCAYLLVSGTDINYVNYLNCTALSALVCQISLGQFPISVLQIRIILLLLRYGADANLPHDAPASDSLAALGFQVTGIYLRKIHFCSPKKEIDLYG